MRLELRVRNPSKKLIEAIEASLASQFPQPFQPSRARVPSRPPPRPFENEADLDKTNKSDVEENSPQPKRQFRKDASKKIATKLDIPPLESGAKATSMPRNEKKHAYTPIITPEKGAWGASGAGEKETIIIPEWQHNVFKPLRRTPHKAIINLSGKFAFLS
jgi:hypothetical protein